MNYSEAINCIYNGEYPKAFNILTEIANNKYNLEQYEACYKLREMYLQGLYVKKDLSKAFEYLKLNENKYNEALNYLQVCVDNDHSFAKIILSYLYGQGLFVEKDKT